jgi:hypothetical protein
MTYRTSEFKVGEGALLIYGALHLIGKPPDRRHPIGMGAIQTDVAYNKGQSADGQGIRTRSTICRGRTLAIPRRTRFGSRATFEPKNEDEIRALRQKYSAEQVKVWYALRSFLTFRSSKHEQSSDEFMDGVLNGAVWKTTELADSVKNVAELQAVCEKVFTGLKDWREVPEVGSLAKGQFTRGPERQRCLSRQTHLPRTDQTGSKG